MKRGLVVAWMLAALAAAPLAGAEEANAPVAAEPTREAEPPISWSVTSASKYCFEGFDYSGGRAVIQPQASAAWRAFELGFWANGDARDAMLNEIDLSLQADWKHGRWSGDAGAQHLHYPHRDWSPTDEVFADLALAGLFRPSLSVHTDVHAGDGSYVTLGIGHDFSTRAGELGLAAKLDLHDHYYGLSGVPALETSAGFAVPLAGVRVEPALSRFWTWSNRDFRGAQALAPSWVFRVTVGSAN